MFCFVVLLLVGGFCFLFFSLSPVFIFSTFVIGTLIHWNHDWFGSLDFLPYGSLVKFMLEASAQLLFLRIFFSLSFYLSVGWSVAKGGNECINVL